MPLVLRSATWLQSQAPNCASCLRVGPVGLVRTDPTVDGAKQTRRQLPALLSSSPFAQQQGTKSLLEAVDRSEAGCAAKGNFKAAIQAELDRSPVCIVANLPTEIPGWNGQIRGNAQLDVLVNVGLVKRSEAMVRRDAMEMAFGGAKSVQGYRYETSDSGKKYVAQLPTMGGSYSHLCYGKKKIVDIVRYTEPSPAMGMTVSQVTYTWKLQDVADWAKNPGCGKSILYGINASCSRDSLGGSYGISIVERRLACASLISFANAGAIAEIP